MKPGWLGVGVLKSGTTWLFRELIKHPKIWGQKKECNFFNNPGRLADYLANFKDCPADKIPGEFSPIYVLHPPTIQRIKQHLPQAKLLLNLRNPVERAFSHYRMSLFTKRIPQHLTFYQAWSETPWMRPAGLYPRLLERLYRSFPKEQVLVTFFDDIVRDPQTLLRSVFSFLGVESTLPLEPAGPNVNKYGAATAHLVLSPQDRRRLIAFYKPSIKRLEPMVGRDLASWLV